MPGAASESRSREPGERFFTLITVRRARGQQLGREADREGWPSTARGLYCVTVLHMLVIVAYLEG